MTTVTIGSLFIACLLPILCTGIAKIGDKSFNNRDPRSWLSKQEGFRKRANAAQMNSWEALALFTAALLVAHQTQGDAILITRLSAGFVVCRIAYIGAYLADVHAIRSLVWFAGFICTVALFFTA